MPNYLDIFAGAGGLSEGFIRAGYEPIAHIEMDKAACYTLKTRLAYKWLSEHQESATYMRYLKREITRKELYVTVPEELLKSVLNYEISKDNLEEIFQKVDRLLNGEALDLIVGGPPCQAYSLVGELVMKAEWSEIQETIYIFCTQSFCENIILGISCSRMLLAFFLQKILMGSFTLIKCVGCLETVVTLLNIDN